MVGSSRAGKRFSFPLSLLPSKLCTGYYRDLFTKCSFCLFLSSPLCPLSLHFSLQFSAAPSNSVCLLMYWLMPSSACHLYFFLSLLPAVSMPDCTHNTHLHTRTWIIWKYDCVWYWTAVCVRHKWWMSFLIKGVKEIYFSSYVILMLCNFKIGTDPLWYKYYIYAFSWHESSSSDSGVLLWQAIFHLKKFWNLF